LREVPKTVKIPTFKKVRVKTIKFCSTFTKVEGYQTLNESLKWLRIKLKYGKNPTGENVKNTFEMDNPQPSS